LFRGTLAAVILAVGCLASARDLSIAVHAGGQAEVVETRELALDGPSTEIKWAPVSPGLDLDSVHFALPGAATALPLSDARVENDLRNRDALLRRYVGKTVRLVEPETRKETAGTLLAVSKGRPAILRREDGALLLDPGGEILLAADPALGIQPELRGRLLTSQKGSKDLQLSYRTGGLKWQAVYSVGFDDKKGTADLAATLVVQNGTDIAFEDAAWRFFATEKHKIRVPEPAVFDKVVEFTPLDADVSLPARDSVRLPLLDARELEVATAFVFDPLADGPRVDTPAQKLQRVIFIPNTAKAGAVGLGVPLPSGKAKVTRRHPSGIVESLGEQPVDFAPVGEMIQIALGAVPDLMGKRTQTPFVELADQRAQEQEVTIRLSNETTTEILATVFEHPWGRWEIPSSEPEYEQLDNETIRFLVSVPAGGETEVKYTLRIKY